MMKPLDLSPDAPWKRRFRAPDVMWAEIADENPQRGIVCNKRTGIYQIDAWDVPSNTLTRLIERPAGVVYAKISPDGKGVYFLHDQQGDERGHYQFVPFEGGTTIDVTPELPAYASFAIDENQRGTHVALMAAYDGKFHAVIVEKSSDGKFSPPREIWSNEYLSFGPGLSHDGEIAIIATTDRSHTTATGLVAVSTSDGRVLNELYDDGSIVPVGFSPQPDSRLLLATSDASGTERPLLWDVSTGERIDIPLPELSGSVVAWDWTPDGSQILLRELHQAEQHLYLYNIDAKTLTPLAHPDGLFGYPRGGEFTSDGDILITHEDAAHARRLVLLDGATGALKKVLLPAESASNGSGSFPEGRNLRSVTFPSTDGAIIQGWVGVPEGDGPFPLILETHGGPTAVKLNSFAPMLQVWLDHGFAVMSINYRGSTTFGRDFERSIWGRLGNVEIDDMAAARDWAVAQGIADPDSILLTGWSYGGYLTLQALGRRPELWAGGMAGIAIADWVLMYEDQADTLRGYQRGLFGGSPEEKPEAHRIASPITYADNVRAPLLVIQGQNDTRCPPRQLQKYEAKLREAGKDIQVHWFDAGHGSRSAEQNIEHQELMLRFAYRVLG